jgi:GTPase SAR1 family protein
MEELKGENLEQDIKKLILVGLDNAGKTSILLSLKGVKNLRKFASVNPTRGSETATFIAFDAGYNIIDLGGQEAYRNTHLKNFKQHLIGTNKIIYVIDVQDEERYDMAIEYLISIINLINEHQATVDFSIFLHKFDPDLAQSSKNIIDSVINGLVIKIKAALPPNFAYTLHKTSIYTVFEKLPIK